MAFDRREYKGAAAATTVVGALSSGATTINIASGTGQPTGATGPFEMVIDRGLTTEEKVKCSSRSGTTLTVASSGRGHDGTSASAHASGATIEHCISAIDMDEANQAVKQTLGTITAKGQLLAGSASGTLGLVSAGTNNQFLVWDSAQAAGVKASAIPSGAISSASMFGAGVVDAAAIATDAVDTAEIKANAVGTAEIADSAVTSAKILDATIVAGDIANATITDAQVAVANKDGAAGTASMRTLSTTSTTACAGNDSRLSDTRTPAATSITQAMFTSGYRATYEATSAPSSPAQGDLWYDTTNKLLKVYSGAVWMTITPGSATVATAEATASASYVDLTTPGPAVTVLTGTKALITLHAHASQNAASGATAAMAVAVSSATTLAAADANAALISDNRTGLTFNMSRTFLLTGLTAGSNVFTAKYKTNANTWTFQDRDITVVAIPT